MGVVANKRRNKGHVPNKGGEMFPRRKSIFQKGKMPTGSSQHERRIANRGRNKGGV